MDLRGTKKLTIFSRKVVFLKDSQLNLRAPNLVQNLNILSPGTDGDDGKHGVHGPTGELRTARNLRLLSPALFRMWLVWVRTKYHLCGGLEVPNPRGIHPRNKLVGMCCRMGSHFHDWVDCSGVTSTTESLEWGRKLSEFWIMQRKFLLSLFFNLSSKVTVYAKMMAGYVNIITSGGNGKPGQNGANGRKAADSMHKVHHSRT